MKSVICTHANPALLKWVREHDGVSIEQVASKIDLPEDRYIELEEGAAHPTLAQLRVLAIMYHRPIGLFFLPKPPKPVRKPKDFRSNVGSLSLKTIHSIRRARNVQGHIAGLLGEISVPRFWSEAGGAHDTFTSARRWLQLDDDTQLGLKDGKALFDHLANTLREKGIDTLIHQFPREDARAYCFADIPQLIVISSNDSSREARCFSLLHELCHLIDGDSGLCSIEQGYDRYLKERKCDIFAANVLMPSQLVDTLANGLKGLELIEDSILNRIASSLCVSKTALIYRFDELGLIDETQRVFKINELRARQVKTSSFGQYNAINDIIKSNGSLLVDAVVGAYRADTIQPTVAAAILDTSVGHLDELASKREIV